MTEGDGQDTKSSRPDAAYGAISEYFRHFIPETTKCSLFCGGKKCKYCTPEKWKKDQMEIDGLYSSWVTDDILATARPSNQVIKSHHIIEQFKKKGINSIINLQIAGEHASCGYGLDPNGFAYDPKTFMDEDVFFYNFGWQDYGVGSLQNILDMVKVFTFAVSMGRVAVHCHAGLGRTGVLIACYLVFDWRFSAHEAINYVRKHRPGAIQTRSQIICIEEFAQYLQPLRIIFSDVEKKTYNFTLTQFMIRQKHMLHGEEARVLKHIPKIIFVIVNALMQIATASPRKSLLRQERPRTSEERRRSMKTEMKTVPSAFNNMPHDYQSSKRHNSPANSKILHSTPSEPSLNRNGHISKSRSFNNLTKSQNYSDDDESEESISDYEDYDTRHSRKDNRKMNKGNNRMKSSKKSNSKGEPESRNGAALNSTYNVRDRSSSSGPSQSRRHSYSDDENQVDLNSRQTREVAEALTFDFTSIDDEELESMTSEKKRSLNTGEYKWVELEEETDPFVLTKLLLDWLQHLKEPVLSAQDLPSMLMEDTVEDGLRRLSKASQHTVVHIFRTLRPVLMLDQKIFEDGVQQLASALCQQHVVLDDDLSSLSTVNVSSASLSRRRINREMNRETALQLRQFLHQLVVEKKTPFLRSSSSYTYLNSSNRLNGKPPTRDSSHSQLSGSGKSTRTYSR